MEHRASTSDLEFRRAFEACETPLESFDHAGHLRLAYLYLCDLPVDGAVARIKGALLAFLRHHRLEETRYHETLTRAWILAVNHFMQRSERGCDSAAAFLDSNPQLLDSKILLTHYSQALLSSPGARAAFVAPDLQSIPPPVG